ncbi:DUF1054 family protein [Companilactobacillus nodensis]|uniref:Uncharacterized protein n=1 Tax=Companilactobacillus nodensis DSM 19682 = JCM 14932 = NBRC 107160 TaxID=1423775 RepID=A0A0R1KAL1_9LACO|nr:DUF1054 family protein [Companilactobacillus nodensis]KRK80726.1 hypothetical protein FD03_GL002156 [Companilactobacillus nodensis DSM 19682 = JCM 14932 = NBRC 107160]
MFDKSDFDVFNDDTLSGRLGLIKQQLDPKFEIFGNKLVDKLEQEYQQKFYMKIAKHQRRTKNPPPDTWLAINLDKSGYKKTPHLELGLWPDRYFITFALLADAYDRPEYYPLIDSWHDSVAAGDWLVSNDHTVAEMKPAKNYAEVVNRYSKVKSSDFVIGFDLLKTSNEVEHGNYDSLLFDKFIELSKFLVIANKEVAEK